MPRFDGPVLVTAAVFEGIDLACRLGSCNMFDVACVLALLEEQGQTVAATWVRTRREDYAWGLIAGFQQAEPGWTARLIDEEAVEGFNPGNYTGGEENHHGR